MRKMLNECVDCTTIGLRCLGRECPNRAVEHFYCDKCGDETQLYEFDGKELCLYCVGELLDIVEGSDL